MDFLDLYLMVVAGIAISIVLPILRKAIPIPEFALSKDGFWKFVKKILIIGVFSLLTGLLIVAFFDESLLDWKAALLAGYAWDSTLQKVAG